MSSLRLFCLLIILTFINTQDKLDSRFILEKLMDNPRELFKAYYSLFDKKQMYNINSKTGIQRYQIFKENVEKIKEMNKKAGVQAYGITQFVDMTNQEYKDYALTSSETIERITGLKFNKTPKTVKSSLFTDVHEVDWTSKLNAAKNQGYCGSCWAFASISAIEGAYHIKFNNLYNLSEQYLVNCDDKDWGCNGGWPTNTFNWLKMNGVQLNEKLPYKETVDVCTDSHKEGAMNIVSGYDYCEGNCTLDKWYGLLSKGPIVVVVDAGSYEFSWYKPANENIPMIPSSCSKINHAVTAVGVKLINGEPYLIIRNSWGTNWGWNGNYIISASNHCFALDYAWLPEVNKHKEYDDDFPEQDCPVFYSSCSSNKKSHSTCRGIPSSNITFGEGESIFGYQSTPNNQNWYFFKEEKCKGESIWSFYTETCFADFSFDDEYFNSFKSVANDNEHPGYDCVYIYTETCYTGNRTKVCNKISDINSSHIDLSKVNSVNFAEASLGFDSVIALILFDEVNFEGNAYSLKRGEHFNLEDNSSFQNALRSAKSLSFVKG